MDIQGGGGGVVKTKMSWEGGRLNVCGMSKKGRGAGYIQFPPCSIWDFSGMTHSLTMLLTFSN